MTVTTSNNLRIDAMGRFFTCRSEAPYIEYPFTLSSDVSGEISKINGREALRQYLIRHKDAGAGLLDINSVLSWVDDQSIDTLHTSVPKHDTSGVLDERFLLY